MMHATARRIRRCSPGTHALLPAVKERRVVKRKRPKGRNAEVARKRAEERFRRLNDRAQRARTETPIRPVGCMIANDNLAPPSKDLRRRAHRHEANASTDPKWAEELRRLAEAIERGDYD